ncbi:uncharacterized protein LOC126907396 isoform X3 [Daktulosphaira vitifoliae]|uniref:uncharacterized protein LOC126907396 isoform X3 n=1 Tax=Daktulosphaira vitifoliae TaxID=58002 RepID=UPI0021A9C676|nr:uncharacterized protein LOC126907396 isoform X3 [Daktulosphaira vitifoliae]
MFSLKLIKITFLLFYVFLYTKAYKSTKKSMNQLDMLLKYPGWKNLNDVSSIQYHKKTYYLESLIETPTDRNIGETKIRALAIYLGCSYTKVINNIFSIILNWEDICINQNKEDSDLISRCMYTKELINKIAIFFVPIATLMKGAMDALDLLHHLPWTNFKICDKKPYMISPVLDRIGNIFGEFLPCDDRSTNSLTFEIVCNFCKRIIALLELETDTYCEFVSYDTNYLWNECVHEYRAFNNQGVKLMFFEFLTKKVETYTKTIIMEKYFQLGFKFDPITEETFIPTPEELIELELEFKATDEEPPTPVQIEIH